MLTLRRYKRLAAKYVASNQYKVHQCLTDSSSPQNEGHWQPEIWYCRKTTSWENYLLVLIQMEYKEFCWIPMIYHSDLFHAPWNLNKEFYQFSVGLCSDDEQNRHVQLGKTFIMAQIIGY